MKYAHTTTFTVMREGERVHTFLGLAGMEWGTVAVQSNSAVCVCVCVCVCVTEQCFSLGRQREYYYNETVHKV